MIATATLVEIVTISIGFLVALATVAAALGVIAKSAVIGRPFRFLWRQNIGQPVSCWHRSIVAEVVDARIDHLMHHNNGGSSLKDLADKVDRLLEHDEARDQPGKRYGA